MANSSNIGCGKPDFLREQQGRTEIICSSEIRISGNRKELDASNAKDKRLQSAGNSRKRRTGFKDSNSNGARTSTNPQSNQNNRGRQERFQSQFARDIPNFQNFPTQPPIRNGNDGLSSKLDGITFSKWRNESIKAGGNAVVPQVVYEIFKTIQQYELNLTEL